MAITNFPAGVSSFGRPVMGGSLPMTLGTDGLGRVFFVDATNGSDGNSGLTPNEALLTIPRANDLVTSNNHDIIALSAHSSHTLTSMLTVSKNRVHFVGLDGGVGRRYGQRARISIGITTAATDIAAILNTGVGNTFTNLKISNDNTVEEGLYTFADGGEYTYMENIELYKSTDLDVTGAAELVCNGDGSHYKNMFIGSTANAISGAIVRPCVTFSRGLAESGKVARDVTFEGVIFARKFGNSANRFLYGAEANCIERMAYLERCIFWGARLSTAVPAQNISFDSSLTEGDMLLHNCTSIRAATAMSTTTGVFVDSAVPTASTSGISVQAS